MRGSCYPGKSFNVCVSMKVQQGHSLPIMYFFSLEMKWKRKKVKERNLNVRATRESENHVLMSQLAGDQRVGWRSCHHQSCIDGKKKHGSRSTTTQVSGWPCTHFLPCMFLKRTNSFGECTSCPTHWLIRGFAKVELLSCSCGTRVSACLRFISSHKGRIYLTYTRRIPSNKPLMSEKSIVAIDGFGCRRPSSNGLTVAIPPCDEEPTRLTATDSGLAPIKISLVRTLIRSCVAPRTPWAGRARPNPKHWCHRAICKPGPEPPPRAVPGARPSWLRRPRPGESTPRVAGSDVEPRAFGTIFRGSNRRRGTGSRPGPRSGYRRNGVCRQVCAAQGGELTGLDEDAISSLREADIASVLVLSLLHFYPLLAFGGLLRLKHRPPMTDTDRSSEEKQYCVLAAVDLHSIIVENPWVFPWSKPG